ncbi:NAD(P)H-dependent oxidoreductase [Thiohalorhabdus sp. Cl-TMA]|uniref:NAD(P)H-dependent oxidoreductase n=1 Tax=Thiohalorhabdus methylotrophus TaxID=3242694 RepID=A0ABV4TSQ1_9GAMM
MNHILIIVGHPSPDSFNAALTQTAKAAISDAGGQYLVHDPYQDGFDPVLSFRKSSDPLTKRYTRDLKEVGGYIVIHPDWWGQPPAMLKGYLDLVFQDNVAYHYPEGGGRSPEGLLSGTAALVLNTSNTAPEEERDRFGGTLEHIWRDCVFGPCGVGSVQRRVFGPVADSTEEGRTQWLGEARELVADYVARNHLVGTVS